MGLKKNREGMGFWVSNDFGLSFGCQKVER